MVSSQRTISKLTDDVLNSFSTHDFDAVIIDLSYTVKAALLAMLVYALFIIELAKHPFELFCIAGELVMSKIVSFDECNVPCLYRDRSIACGPGCSIVARIALQSLKYSPVSVED